MSKYSMVHKGEVLPYRFEKKSILTNFYCGDIFLGQIFKTGLYYSAVSFTIPVNHMNYVNGFKSRWNACDWLIEVFKYYDKENTNE